MLDEQARQMLQQPITARLSTITPEGYPHTVPIWFMLEGNDLVLVTSRQSRKVKNLQANPKGSLSLGGDPFGCPGYLIEGDFAIEEDADHGQIARITHHYEPPEQARKLLDSWKDADLVVLRLRIRRVVKI